MTGRTPEQRVALARLLLEGRLQRTAGAAAVADHAVAVGWATQTTRAREVALTPAGASDIPTLLGRAWPAWRADLADLEAHDLPLSVDGLARLAELRRLEAHTPAALPARLNRRTAQARWARHSKSPLGPAAQGRLGATLTSDDVVRLRPSRGLALRLGDRVDPAPGALTGEIIVPERALLDGLTFEGAPPRRVLTVENLGAYIDLVVTPDTLIVWLPGWNSPLALTLLDRLPPTPHVHFGDLDPEGAAIVAHLRARAPREVEWLVPSFWADYEATHALPCAQPWPAPDPRWPPLVQRLAATARWLEQEAIVPDPRLAEALAE